MMRVVGMRALWRLIRAQANEFPGQRNNRRGMRRNSDRQTAMPKPVSCRHFETPDPGLSRWQSGERKVHLWRQPADDARDALA